MSGDHRPDERQSAELVPLYAEHWRRAPFEEISDRCTSAVAGCAALRSLSYFNNGVVDFVIRPADAPPLPGGRELDLPIDVESRPGHQLVLSMETFDKALGPLLTGALMRTVVATPTGGLYCGRVKEQQHIVGITLRGDGVDAMDRTLNELVTDIRVHVLNRSAENPGGVPEQPYHSPDGSQELHFTAGSRVDEPLVARLRGLWQRHLNPVDLQYLAYYENWHLACVGDAFDDTRIGKRFLNIKPSARRRKYRDVADQLRDDIARLRDMLQLVSREPMNRLVLDVEEGAVYFHWLPGGRSGDFLCGVTLDQHEVGNAERRLREVLSELPRKVPRPRSVRW
ncbi:hypothetical protein ACFWIA_05070 [Streptomyces sp. NPDC127068]|uniref:hypothetical protein n=1 Tax=Streptomyces sp. NPDC127068 TaxID=3347127 RepID=UPI003654BDE5